MKSNEVAEVFTNIRCEAGGKDKRQYQGLQLENGMKVMLISDPSTDKSAASLDVHVGFMSDPCELPGLAHFCEHMLFMGTEKYPEENAYSKYLVKHSGFCNAFTGAEHTNYYFDVAPDYLEGAIERFAQFFICPLFSGSSTDREVHAVNAEHEQNLKDDMWRFNQLERSVSNPAHDYNRFGTGNIETLDVIPKAKSISVQKELLKFHDKFYSANIMTLAVIGKESLKELAAMIQPRFSVIENKNVKLPVWNENPYNDKHLQVKEYIVPIKDTRMLVITFNCPDVTPLYKSKPDHYLAHLIAHEGPGSLFAELKSRGWVDTLVGSFHKGGSNFGFFILNMELTEEGIEYIDDIITLMFQYLNMLKQVGPQSWIYHECQQIASLQFEFKDKEKAQSLVTNVAENLHIYPFEHVLSGPYLMHYFNPDDIEKLLQYLMVENMRVAVIGKKFEEVCNETEKWYGTKYKLEPFDEIVVKKWKCPGLHENLKLPLRNEFIPETLDLAPREPEFHKFPQLIKNTEFSRLWFKQDDDFLLPKSTMSFEIQSPLAYLDPHHYNVTHMLLLLLKDALNEYTYNAKLAGLSYNVGNTKFGILLVLRGFHDKQGFLLQKIMDKLLHFQFDEKRFEILKENYIRKIKNFEASLPFHHAEYYIKLLLCERIWSHNELLECMNDLTFENITQICPQILSRVHIESLVHGNLTKEQALHHLDIVEDSLKLILKTKPLTQSQLTREREYQLTDGCYYLFEASNKIHHCSALEIYYQCGLQETKSNVLLELFAHLISEPFFNQIRTQEQLGYIVFCGLRRSNGVQGLKIIVQSDKPPSYIDSRVEAFLQHTDHFLQKMSIEEFETYKQALAARRLEKPKNLIAEAVKLWQEIACHEYNFDRDSIEVMSLKDITKEDIYLFFKDLISYDAPKRKKLAIHVVSSVSETIDTSEEIFPCHNIDGTDNLPDEISNLIPPPPAFSPASKIDNVIEFKTGLGLYPLTKPFISIPPPVPDDHPSKSKL